MTKVFAILYVVLILGVMFSCDNNKASDDVLLRMKYLTENDSERALVLLDSITLSQEIDQELYMQYIVNRVEIKSKNKLNIYEDSLIFEAQNYFNQKGEPKQAALANYYAGAVCFDAKLWERAIDCFRRTIDYANQTDDYLIKAKSFHCLGSIFYENNLKDSVIINSIKAFDLYSKIPNTDLYKMKVLINIGLTYDEMGQYDNAENYIKQSFDIANQTGNKLYQGHGNQNLGLICLDKKEYGKALNYFRKALPAMENISDSIIVYLNLSKLYTETHKLDSATYYMNAVKKTLPLIVENRTLAYTYDILKAYYKKEHDYEKALYYATLSDSVRKVLNNRDLAIQLHQAETKKWEAAVYNERKKIKQNMLVTWVVVSNVIVLFLLAIFILYSKMSWKLFVEKRKKNKEIAYVRDQAFQFNALINYKVMKEWNDICSSMEEIDPNMNWANQERLLYPRIGKTINKIHKKISCRLISLGKEFLLTQPNGEKGLRYMKDEEILCMMLAYHKYPLKAVELILDKPFTQKDFQGTLWAIQVKLRQAKFSEERIQELLYLGKSKKHIV